MVLNIVRTDRFFALLRALEKNVCMLNILKCIRDFLLAGLPFITEGIDRTNGKN